MKKIRKGKKMLIIILIAIVVILAIVFIIRGIVKNINKEPVNPVEEQQQVISLPETTYSDMEVRNIYMEYLKDNNETMITFRVYNSTSAKVENKKFTAVLVGEDEKILGQMGPISIDSIAINEEQEFSVIYKGDLTATKLIKLEEIK